MLAPAPLRDAVFRCARREAAAAGFNVTVTTPGPDTLLMMRTGPANHAETGFDRILFTVIVSDSAQRPELRTDVSGVVVSRMGIQYPSPSARLRAAADSIRAHCRP